MLIPGQLLLLLTVREVVGNEPHGGRAHTALLPVDALGRLLRDEVAGSVYRLGHVLSNLTLTHYSVEFFMLVASLHVRSGPQHLDLLSSSL